MKKGIWMLLSLMVLLGLVTACSGNNTSDPAKETSKAENQEQQVDNEKQVTIKFMLWADSAMEGMYEELIRTFEDSHPNINVETMKTEINAYNEKLTILLTGGGEIDAFPFKNTQMLVEYASKNRIPELDDFVSESEYDLSSVANLIDTYKVNNKIYGLPFRKDVWGLFYNKKIFDDAGIPYPTDITWEEYSELAQQLTKGEGQDKIWGSFSPDWPQNWYAQAQQLGGNYMVDEDFSNYRKALQWKKDLVDSNAHPTLAQNKSTNAHYRTAFLSGKYAMVYTGSWFTGMLELDKEDGKLDFEWNMTYLPHPEGVEVGTSMTNSTLHAIAPDSKYKEEAFKFISYMSSEEGQRIVAKYQTPASSASSVADAYKSNFSFDVNLDQVINVKPVNEIELTEGAAEVTKILTEEGNLALLGEITVEQAIENIIKRRADVLKK